jgi:DNA repair protein RecO (recombination protein O)
MMRQERTSAVVLRRTNYGEADRIIQLLTPNGRRSVMAKGVRKERSKLAGGIELLSESDIVIRYSEKGSLGILGSARMKKFFGEILHDYDRMTFAYEVLGLVAKASEQVDEPQWYDLTTEVLEGLNAPNVPLSLIKAWFYLHYAGLVGYELSVWRDVAGEEIEEAARYRYDVGERGLRKMENGEITSNHIRLLRLLSSKPIIIIMKVGGVQEYLADCATLARQHASVD